MAVGHRWGDGRDRSGHWNRGLSPDTAAAPADSPSAEVARTGRRYSRTAACACVPQTERSHHRPLCLARIPVRNLRRRRQPRPRRTEPIRFKHRSHKRRPVRYASSQPHVSSTRITFAFFLHGQRETDSWKLPRAVTGFLSITAGDAVVFASTLVGVKYPSDRDSFSRNELDDRVFKNTRYQRNACAAR